MNGIPTEFCSFRRDCAKRTHPVLQVIYRISAEVARSKNRYPLSAEYQGTVDACLIEAAG